MTLLAVFAAGLLAAAGAASGEWWRLRRRWHPQIAPSYWTAVASSCCIVMTQALILWLGGESTVLRSEPSPWLSMTTAFMVGPALHGITWNLLLLAWRMVRMAALAGRRSPRG